MIVMDFESLASTGAGFTFVTTYSEDGFTLTGQPGARFASPHSDKTPWFLGSTTLFLDRVDGVTVLTKDDGGAFDVVSIDISEFVLTSTATVSVSFTGVRADASSESVTFTTDGVGGLETFTFSGFTNLITLSWVQESPFHQFDNITFSSTDPTTKDECKNGGWEAFGFRNQGQCVRFVNTGKDSR